MLAFSSTVVSQISFIIDSLNASNYDSVIQDLCQFVEYGVDGSILLLKTCMNHVNIHEGHTDEDRLKLYMLSVIFRYLMDRPNFTTIICHSLLSYANESFLEDLSEALDLSFAERIGIGLALSDSEDVDLRSKGQNFSMVHIKNVCANPNLGHGVTHDQIQNIILFLHRNVGFSKHVDAFMQILSLLHLKEKTPLTLAPFLTTCSNESDSPWDFDLPGESNEHDFDDLMAEMQTEMNMADIFKELGYGCTLSDFHCKEILALFSPLNETVIARIIGTVVSTHTGLEDCQVTYATFCSALGKPSAAEFSCLNSWNINVLLDSIKQIAPGTNWSAVMDNLDYEGFYILDERSFLLFMSIYRNACQEPFPLHAACGFPWKNAEGQLSFLRYAVSAAPEIFTFSHSTRILSYFDPAQANKISQVCPNQSWLCLDLLQILCELAERGHSAIIRTMLEYPLKHLPEALLVGLAHVNTAFNLIQNDVSSAVFPRAFENSSRNSTLHALWRTNPNLVMRGFIDMQSIEPDSSSKILDICHELKILGAVLDMSPFASSIKLAALAAKKEYLHLENWLSEMMKKCKDTFFEECLKFLKERVLFDASNDMSSGLLNQSVISLNISPEITNVFFKVLQFFSGQVSHQLSDELRRLRATTTHGIPRSQSGVSESSMPEDFPEDIEAEANSFYQQLFVGQLSMDAIVQMLTRFKESSDEREQSIFDCMIHNLFDEYKYFHRYPERQLKITAVLFGSLIKHKLVSHLILGIALRVVLDSLRKSIDSKMFLFGITALEQFMDRLEEWPGFCNNILQISHLRGANGELVSFIERALARVSSRQSEAIGGSVVNTDQLSLAPPQDPSESNEAPESPWPLNGSSGTQLSPQHSSSVQPVHQRNQGFADDQYKTSSTPTNYGKPASASSGLSSSISSHTDQKSSQLVPTQQTSSATTSMLTSPGFQRPTRSATPGGFGSALNIGTLVAAAERRETPIQAPPEEVHDKIFFLINNISLANLETKAREFTEMLKEEYYPWFALYMVMKRASIEPNFHDLYLKFLDKIHSRELNKEIVKATYENCKVLLRSELIKSSSEERSLLKNLGSWLGKFTIGRNQTLRAKEIDPKALIIEAYEKGLMIAVIPFTSKILEPCATSLAYQPPNPWTMGVLGLLVEIYALPNLKMNLKFDIEVLFKNLKMELKDVIPTSLLKDRVRDMEGNPDFSTKDLAATQHQVVADINPGLIASLSQVDLPAEVIAPTLSGHANYTGPIHLTSSMLGDDDKLVPIGLPEHLPSGQGLSQVAQVPYSTDQVVISPKLSSLGQSLPLSRLVQVAMERAINEILLNVVNRSVSIASMTTKELVSKDYAMEADESRMRNAANMMIASLAASLAHVACKDTLRQGIASHLRSYLQTLNISSEVLDQTVQILANDNLDLGCACVENMATEKALQKLEGDFPELVAMRRKQREGLTAAYFEATSYAQGFLACLPESLRPKPGRLTVIQHRVYEDFARWQHQPTQGLNNMPAATNQLSSAGGYVLSSLPHGYAPSSGQMTSSVYTNTAIGVGFGFNPQHLRHTSDDMDLSVPPGHSGAIEGAVVDMTSVASPLITAAESNARATDSSATVKDPGSSQQPPPSPATADRIGASILEPMLTTGDALEKYELIAQKMELLLLRDALDSDIKAVIAEVPEIILRCLSRDEAALAIAQKVFRNLYDSSGSILHLTYYLSVLVAIRDVSKLVVKELTSWVIYSDEDRKYNKDIVIGLICSELLNLAEYDMYLAKLIDGGRNKPATEFAISLIQTLVSQEPGQSLSEFRNLVDTFAKLATRPGSPESLQKLVETIRNLSNTVLGEDDKARLFSDKKASSIRVLPTREEVFAAENSSVDPPGFRDQVLYWFTEWARICDTPGISDAAYLNYITQLQQGGMLKDDVSERFFRVLLELAVAHCLNKDGNPASSPHQAPQQVQNLSFAAIDMLAKLVFLLVKFSAADQGATKVSPLSKVLNVSVRTLQKDAEERKASFNHRPFFRLFMNWIYDFSSADPSLDSIYFQVLTAFASTFHALQPLKVPGFSYAWLELVSHRCFMPRLLNINYPKGSPLFQRLLVDLFKFLEPYLRNAELGEPVQMLYKGTLRVLLVLLHDFPDFLCEYHFSFCDVIPPSCIQMRNVILSAFPPNMRLPDPFMPNLKVDLLPEISRPPKIQSDVEGALKAKQMKAELDDYLKTRQAGSTFLMDFKQRLLLPPSEASVSGTRYNVSLINSLVLYVGMQEIHQMQSMATPRMTDTASSDIFQKLIVDLDTEGRYLFLNAIANQLRYPNNHTHFFSCVLLYLFGEATQDIIQEQITRVLLERLIVNRPHPWGLLITFIELIKNPAYRFWNRPFTRCAPEIEKLFEQVSKSCGGPMRSVEDALVSGSVGDIPR